MPRYIYSGLLICLLAIPNLSRSVHADQAEPMADLEHDTPTVYSSAPAPTPPAPPSPTGPQPVSVKAAPALKPAPAPTLAPTLKSAPAPAPAPAPSTPSAAPAPAPAPAPQTAPEIFQPKSAADENMSCQEFFELIKSSGSETIEQALAEIQKKRPKFLTHTVYAYQSKNPFDAASMVFPRAFVYGGDAKMVLSFGGARRFEANDRMELMCFNDTANKFELHDVVFVKEALSLRRGHDQTDSSDLTELEKTMKSVVMTGGRGRRECSRCHDSSARPIWNAAFFWPGVYGAIDDSLTDANAQDSRPIYEKIERLGWTSFQAIAKHNKRYQKVTQVLKRPNSDFTARLSYLNGKRIISELKAKGAAFEAKRFEFAKALFCAPQADREFFKEGQSSNGQTVAVLPRNADLFIKDIFLDAYDDEMQKERRLGEILSTRGYPSPFPKEHLDSLRAYYRELFKDKELNLDLSLSSVNVDEVLMMRELQRITEKLEIDIANWSMVPSGGFVHANGFGGEGRPSIRLILERPFVDEFLKDDQQLKVAILERENLEQTAFDESQKKGLEPKHSPEIVAGLHAAQSKICGLLEKRKP